MAEDTVILSVRLPKALHEKLVKEAKEEHRSLNGQIVMHLDHATKTKASKR